MGRHATRSSSAAQQTFIDVSLPTATVAGYISLVQFQGGNSVTSWTEVLDTSLAGFFASHNKHGLQVVDHPQNITAADQIAVVWNGTELSLMDRNGLVGNVTHALSTQDAAAITAQAVPGPVTGDRDDVFVNVPDGLAWIHDGSGWVHCLAVRRADLRDSADDMPIDGGFILSDFGIYEKHGNAGRNGYVNVALPQMWKHKNTSTASPVRWSQPVTSFG